MNVFSAFDGISCGQLALQRAGIKVDKYYASEIDKHAIKVTQHHFPETIQLGDITKIKGIDLPKIDLMIGGSPCTSFSIAGNKTGFNGKSGLFYEYARLLKEIKPTYFLLENVKMRKEWETVITNQLGVECILIDSNSVSAQNRKRLYWTNIPNVTQPKDLNIGLSDIVQVVADKSNLNLNELTDDKYIIITALNGKKVYIDTTLNAPYTFYETRTQEGKDHRRMIRKSLGIDSTPRSKEFKKYMPLLQNKANCLVTMKNALDFIIDKQWMYRCLTIEECEMLQTLPIGYTSMISENQRRKCIGNGWTVDVIAHIFSSLQL